MSAHLPILIVVCPMIAALVVPLLGQVSARLARGVTVVTPAVALVCAVGALRVALDSGP